VVEGLSNLYKVQWSNINK